MNKITTIQQPGIDAVSEKVGDEIPFSNEYGELLKALEENDSAKVKESFVRMFERPSGLSIVSFQIEAVVALVRPHLSQDDIEGVLLRLEGYFDEEKKFFNTGVERFDGEEISGIRAANIKQDMIFIMSEIIKVIDEENREKWRKRVRGLRKKFAGLDTVEIPE